MAVLISVVIPIYNQEKYIGDCLESVLPMCTDEVEVVLVNDGSTDRSESVCRDTMRRYSANVRLITQQNSGALKSRMKGIEDSTGEYILFVDSDDMLLEGALDTLLQTLHKKCVDMILFNATCDIATSKPKFDIPLEHGRELTGEDRYEVYRLLCNSDVLNNLWTKCIRKDLFQYVALPEDGQRLTNGEDLYQILALADHAKSFIYLDRVLYFYRVMQTGISRVYNEYYFDSEKVVCAKRLEYAEKWSRKDELIAGVQVQTYKIMREVARKLLISGKPWKEIKKVMQKYRNDAFFRQYYLQANDAPDRRDRILKGPYPVMWAFKRYYDLKNTAKHK